MSVEQIVISITPADDGVHCGECDYFEWSGPRSCWCTIYGKRIPTSVVRRTRLPECIIAARTLREEREAARALYDAALDTMATGVTAAHLDSAVAQYEAARGEGA